MRKTQNIKLSGIVAEITPKVLMSGLNCGPSALSNAISRGYFPPRWYPVVKHLGFQCGINVPDNHFDWSDCASFEELTVTYTPKQEMSV